MKNTDHPILIFKGNTDVCYGILRSFSDHMKNALESIGENVIYLDPKEDFISGYANREYKAVIAFMDTLFDNFMPGTETPLFDQYHGPKFNYWTDHPATFCHQFEKTPRDYYILTQDRNYVKFISRYYNKCKAFYLPPGGGNDTTTPGFIPFCDRRYDVSFVGTYNNWKEYLQEMTFDEQGIILRDTYIDVLLNQYDLTAEDALKTALGKVGIVFKDEDFIALLNLIRPIADRVVAGLFRERIIGELLDEQIYVDVFGDSWKKSSLSENSYLRIHDSVDPSCVSDIYSNSRVSLNIMSWHKDAVTERILDSMYSGSIALTDRTNALGDLFIHGEDILFFSLSDIAAVPRLIRTHMDDEALARRGQKKVLDDHMWTNRARELLNIIRDIGE